MPRPTLLVAETEPLQALSVRKLVLETAKFNVLTAHSTREAIDLFHLFPNISGAIVACAEGIDGEKIADAIKSTTTKVPVVALIPNVAGVCRAADHTLSGHQPERLLELVRSLFGDPRLIDSH